MVDSSFMDVRTEEREGGRWVGDGWEGGTVKEGIEGRREVHLSSILLFACSMHFRNVEYHTSITEAELPVTQDCCDLSMIKNVHSQQQHAQCHLMSH